MRIFVDELPNCCGNCGFCCKDDLGYWCQSERLVYIADELVGKKRLQFCPLQTIADYEKQVRKQVCDEIKEFLENHKYKVLGDYNHQTLQYNETYICELLEINKFLDQIEKGE